MIHSWRQSIKPNFTHIYEVISSIISPKLWATVANNISDIRYICDRQVATMAVHPILSDNMFDTGYCSLHLKHNYWFGSVEQRENAFSFSWQGCIIARCTANRCRGLFCQNAAPQRGYVKSVHNNPDWEILIQLQILKNYLSDMRTSPCLLDGTFMRNILLLITGLSLMILSAVNRVYNIGDPVPDIYSPVRISGFNISRRYLTNWWCVFSMTYFMWRPTGPSLTLGDEGIRGQKIWPMAVRSSPNCCWKVEIFYTFLSWIFVAAKHSNLSQ